MSELDEAWALALAAAERKARAAGRMDISAYLALRTSNDLLRKTGSEWLHSTFVAVADEANRAGAGIHVAREEGFRFKVGATTMVGTCSRFTKGVRTLSVEVGWPRTPPDGFIRGGGLAYANIKHLGIKSANEQLRLTTDSHGVPRWSGHGRAAEPHQIHEANIRDHIAILLNDSRDRARHP